MVRAIREHLLPLGVQILHDDGNALPLDPTRVTQAGDYFLYVTFPRHGTLPEIADITKLARDKYFLQIAPGHIYQVNNADAKVQNPEAFCHGARLSWAWHEEEDILEGIRRLAELLKATQNNTATR